jgi:spoIIIJ-associated protein
MSTLEIEEKTVEQAIDLACQRFNLPREQLEIEVLSRGSSGIFGIVGVRKARIRVTPRAPSLEGAAERAKAILATILAHVDLPTVVESQATDGQITLNIISNGSGLLIGKRGKMLNALQHLVSKILHREVGEACTVIVDTENYRAKREIGLAELAQQLSDKVKKTGRPQATTPMSAHDRRIIHLTLQGDEEVRTKSKGEGNLRKVMIYPVKKEKAGKGGPPPGEEEHS